MDERTHTHTNRGTHTEQQQQQQQLSAASSTPASHSSNNNKRIESACWGVLWRLSSPSLASFSSLPCFEIQFMYTLCVLLLLLCLLLWRLRYACHTDDGNAFRICRIWMLAATSASASPAPHSTAASTDAAAVGAACLLLLPSACACSTESVSRGKLQVQENRFSCCNFWLCEECCVFIIFSTCSVFLVVCLLV